MSTALTTNHPLIAASLLESRWAKHKRRLQKVAITSGRTMQGIYIIRHRRGYNPLCELYGR